MLLDLSVRPSFCLSTKWFPLIILRTFYCRTLIYHQPRGICVLRHFLLLFRLFIVRNQLSGIRISYPLQYINPMPQNLLSFKNLPTSNFQTCYVHRENSQSIVMYTDYRDSFNNDAHKYYC